MPQSKPGRLLMPDNPSAGLPFRRIRAIREGRWWASRWP
jgi:hypothetical protein